MNQKNQSERLINELSHQRFMVRDAFGRIVSGYETTGDGEIVRRGRRKIKKMEAVLSRKQKSQS